LTVVITSAVIVGVALALGSGTNVLSFITQQTSRSLQVESPVSTLWMWLSYFHVGGSFPYYNETINTFEVTGPSTLAVAALLNPLLGMAALVIAALGVVAVQRGAPVTELLAPLSLAFVTAFIVFNKVGSPQYMTWIAVPILLGLATHAMGFGRSFRFPSIIALAAAGFTQVFYPYWYEQLLYLNVPLLVALTVRNILTVVLFVWSVSVVIRLTRPFVHHEQLLDSAEWLPTAWPFTDRVEPVLSEDEDDTTSRTPQP
jgi:hypothetical protein